MHVTAKDSDKNKHIQNVSIIIVVRFTLGPFYNPLRDINYVYNVTPNLAFNFPPVLAH